MHTHDFECFRVSSFGEGRLLQVIISIHNKMKHSLSSKFGGRSFGLEERAFKITIFSYRTWLKVRIGCKVSELLILYFVSMQSMLPS